MNTDAGHPESFARLALRAVRRLAKRMLGRDDGVAPTEPTKHLWSIGIYSGPSPLELAPDRDFPSPVMTRDHVTDASALIVADPFLHRAGGTWNLFFEALNRENGRGEIALATSDDLATWRYRQVVLAEPFHLSYPFVFEWEGEQYMIPEAHKTMTVRLYRAAEFPQRWEFVHTLISGERFADSTLFRHGDRWWLFSETSPARTHDVLRLYSAADLLGPWIEHPASPIVSDNPRTARPAGSVVRHDGRLYRFAQDCVPRYGVAVRAFEITRLTTTEYAERAVGDTPVLGPGESSWNEAGMHHIDAHEVSPGRWVAAVDGWRAATVTEIYGQR